MPKMVDKLGAKGAAQEYIKAADYFDANKDQEHDDERPQPMTAKAWKVPTANGGAAPANDSQDPQDSQETLVFNGEGEDEEDMEPDEPVSKRAKRTPS